MSRTAPSSGRADAAVVPLRAVRLVAARSDALPPWADVLVEAQDRWLVLGDSPDGRARDDDPEARLRELDATSLDDLLADLERHEPARGGSVLLRRTRPLRLLAVVHDLEHEPSLREDWVRDALGSVLHVATRAHVRGIALPLLARPGDIDDLERFADALAEALEAAPLARVRLAILASPAATRRLATALRETGMPFVVEVA